MSFTVEVITTKRDDPNVIIDQRTMNWDRSNARAWLSKHSNWALRNGHAIHIASVA